MRNAVPQAPNHATGGPDLWLVADVANYLRVSRAWVYRAAGNHPILPRANPATSTKNLR